MKENKPLKNKKSRRIWILLGILLALAVAGGGFLLWQNNARAVSQADSAGYQTSQVRTGDLSISVTASGTLAAGKTTNLSFPTSGVVAAVHVIPGDEVTEGQVLAELADTTSLQIAATTASLELKTAQQALDDLQNNASSNLANAQLAAAEARKAYAEAQSGLLKESYARCDSDTIEAYYYKYMKAFESLEALQAEGNSTQDYYLNRIVPAKNAVDQAYATYEYCAGYTEYEIDSSEAELVLTKATMEKAEADLQALIDNQGIDPDAQQQAQNDLALAKIASEQAQKNLAAAKMTAPFDGTILSVAGQAGDEVGTSIFITIADLAHPVVDFYVDESDLASVAVGYSVHVTFDALPDEVFTGTVTQLSPSLQTYSGSYSVVSGVATLDLAAGQDTKRFIEGLNGTVEIIAGEAKNALLVPVEALRDLGDGTYGVFVVDATGQLNMKVVTVGLMDATYAEITSGLQAGETVSTGIVETN